jgi:hypothetical protein
MPKEDVITVDGMEQELIGYGDTFLSSGITKVAVYDGDACIAALMKEQKWDIDEAMEFFQFNVLGSFLGEGMPVFVFREEE